LLKTGGGLGFGQRGGRKGLFSGGKGEERKQQKKKVGAWKKIKNPHETVLGMKAAILPQAKKKRVLFLKRKEKKARGGGEKPS